MSMIFSNIIEQPPFKYLFQVLALIHDSSLRPPDHPYPKHIVSPDVLQQRMLDMMIYHSPNNHLPLGLTPLLLHTSGCQRSHLPHHLIRIDTYPVLPLFNSRGRHDLFHPILQ